MIGRTKRVSGGVAFLVFFAALSLGSCSDDSPNPQLDPRLVGNWQPVDGDLFSFFPGVDFVVLQLRDDSTGEAVFRDPESGALACVDLLFAQLSDQTLFIEMEIFDETTAFLPNSFAFAIDEIASGELAFVLLDNVGSRQTFLKLDAPPAGAECQSFSEVVASEELEADPVGDTGLVWDGTSLWFGVDAQPNDQLMPYDPATGELGPPIDWSSNVSEVQAYDGTNLWFNTGVGYIASRRDFGDVETDTIDTDLDLGHKVSISAMAWDGTHLWLSGDPFAAGSNELIEVDAATKTVVNRHDFPRELGALTWDGTHFWGILDGSPSPLLQIDPDTWQVVATYDIPGYAILFHNFRGIAAVGEDLYVLVQNRGVDSTTATILRATP